MKVICNNGLSIVEIDFINVPGDIGLSYGQNDFNQDLIEFMGQDDFHDYVEIREYEGQIVSEKLFEFLKDKKINLTYSKITFVEYVDMLLSWYTPEI